jgi:enterochelin esterase family protein
MNKILNLFSLILFTSPVNASSIAPEQEKIVRAEYPTDTLYKLWLDQQENNSAALNFYNSLLEKHIIELNEKNKNIVNVTYFAKGSTDTDYIMQTGGPDLYGLRFKKIGSSNIYFCIQSIPKDAWFAYSVNEFKKTKILSPINIEQTSTVHIYDGTVIGPDAPLSAFIHPQLSTPKGTLQEFEIWSKHMKEQRKIQVYLPAAYNKDVTHSLVLQFDGQNYAALPGEQPDWQGWTPMPTILDNLIHQKKIGPTIAVFIHNQGNRSRDLISDQITDFVALELIPWVRENYNIASKSKEVIVSGASRAGFAAAHTALRHPSIVGAFLSQSGSFYYTLQEKDNWPVYPQFEGELVIKYKRSEKQDVRFYLDVGLYDLGLAAVGTNRQLRDVLELKGYQGFYYEYKGGHSHLSWRHTLDKGLNYLLGTEKFNK